MPNEKRRPNWTLCINEAPQGAKPHWRNIGAAWETATGNLFVKVDEGEALRGTAMLFPYREREGGGTYRRENYRKGTQDYHRPAPPPAPAPNRDYMDRKREERRAPLPSVPTTDLDPDPEAPEWL